MQRSETAPTSGVYAHRGTTAIQRLVEYAPGTGGLALWMRHCDDDRIDGKTIASTDGVTIRYGCAFETLSLRRQTGIVAHEVLHVALRHVPRYRALQRQLGHADLNLFNICADAVINSALSHLAWLEIEPRAVRLETLLSRVLGADVDPTRALLEWNVERLYRAIDDRREPSREPQPLGGARSLGPRESRSPARASRWKPSSAQDDGPRASMTRVLGHHIRRDLVPSDDSGRPEMDAELAQEWHERVLRGHTSDGNASMLRALLADLPQLQTPWEHRLRTQLARGLSLRRARSWSRPSRAYIANHGRIGAGKRMPWEPGWSSSQAVARLAIMVDVSGSIDASILRRFSNELAAITRRHEAPAVVIIGDDRVRSVVRFEPGHTDLSPLVFRGGGDTDFSPLLKAADRYRPDIGVFLTDLKGPATYRPGFPVLWAVPVAHAGMEPPFGRKLVLD